MSKQLDRLNKRLAAIPKRVREAVQLSLIQSGDELVARMRALAPEDSGDLKKSITATPPGQATPAYSQPGGSQVARENQVLVTVGNSEVRYAHLIEYGVSHRAATPFFWPAYRLTRKRIANRVKRAMRKAIKEAK